MCSPLDFNDPYDSRIRIGFGDKEEFFNFMIKYFETQKIQFGTDAVYVASAKLGFPLHDIDPEQSDFKFPQISGLFYELLSKISNFDTLLAFAKEKNLHNTTILFLEFITKTGVTSFSSQYEDPHMWAYYADNHKGFCVKYKVQDTDGNKLANIKYTKNPHQYLADQDISTSNLQSFIVSKSEHWKSEKESRLITFNGRNSLVSCPFKIESICAGLKMDKKDINLLRSIVEDDVIMHYSLLDEHKFRIRWIEEESCFL